jgi:hypothetical protein
MTLIQQLSQDHATLRQADAWKNLPQLKRVHLVIREPETWSEPIDVETGIAGLELKAIGWIRRQSEVAICPRAVNTLDPTAEGLPIAGEWVIPTAPSEPRKSAQLRYSGGLWRLNQFVEHDRSVVGGRDFLRQEALFLARKAMGYQRLHYAVYWGADEDDPAALRRVFARFTGFGTSEQAIIP